MSHTLGGRMLEGMYAQFVTGIAVLAQSVEGGQVEERDGVTVTAVGRGHHEFNTAWVTRAPQDLEATFGWAAETLRGTGRPWHIQVPETVGLTAGDLTRRFDLRVVERVPAMVLEIDDADVVAPDGVTIHRVEDPGTLARLRDAMSRGFGGPGDSPDPSNRVITEPLLDDPRVAMFLAHVEDHVEPVGTSVAISEDGVTGVYGITTMPSHRRRGIGTAVTGAAIVAGREAGSTHAVLQATEMGAPVYARMGFETITWYDRLGPAS